MEFKQPHADKCVRKGARSGCAEHTREGKKVLNQTDFTNRAREGIKERAGMEV